MKALFAAFRLTMGLSILYSTARFVIEDDPTVRNTWLLLVILALLLLWREEDKF